MSKEFEPKSTDCTFDTDYVQAMEALATSLETGVQDDRNLITAIFAAAIDAKRSEDKGTEQLPGFAINLARGLYNHSNITIDPSRLSQQQWRDLFFSVSAKFVTHRAFVAEDKDILRAMIDGDRRISFKPHSQNS
ncbi:MAG: hypothetical protein ACREF5_02285 [Candidatus Saccharimonadales bacterium]